ncbi:MAG: VOC family protein [Anaeromyxobacter sp.]
MIDHVTVTVRDHARSRAFYLAALAPVGHGRLVELPPGPDGGVASGFCHEDGSDFWFREGAPQGRPVHVAFRAPTRAAVDAFHAAALAAGGRDNGAPGLRPQYHAHYYAAFVLDPDGNNVEAVCHEPA